MLTVGQVVDRYVVEGPLGEGGMAVVYRVRHDTLNSLHALKVLTVPGDRVRERLLAEGRAQGQLQHPNALTVTDIIDVEGQPGLVMEYVEGGTLEEWLHRVRPDREDRLEALRQICDCVAMAHDKGWIHRDLKPSNVLMDQMGDDWVPKVADFGLVKALEVPLGKAKTKQGIAMGTPGFMATEQFTNAANVKPSADVFSLGCVLIWLITEVEPFEGETPIEVYRNVAANVHVGLKPTDPLFDLSERCLDPDPAKRPQTARELLTELEHVIGAGKKPVDFGALTRTPAPARREFAAPRVESEEPLQAPIPQRASIPDSSSSISRGRGGCLIGTVALAGFILVPVLLVLGLGLAKAIQYNNSICNLQGVGSMGWVEARNPRQDGKIWRLPVSGEVMMLRDGVETYRCRLPRGTRVRIDTHKGGKLWLSYDPEAKLPGRVHALRTVLGHPAN